MRVTGGHQKVNEAGRQTPQISFPLLYILSVFKLHLSIFIFSPHYCNIASRQTDGDFQPSPGPPPGPPRPRPGARLLPDRTPPEGPAFLIIRCSDSTSMANASVFGVRHQIHAVCGDVLSAKTTQSGALLVRTASQQQNEVLLSLTHFLMRPCEVDGPNSVEGLIHCPKIAGISQKILYELAPQGVVEVLRLRSRVEGRPKPLVRLRFRGQALPTRIYCGYLAVPVRQWIPGPRQCRKCWNFGHGAKFCRSSRTTCAKQIVSSQGTAPPSPSPRRLSSFSD